MILRAAWVAPVSGPPIRDGYVRFEGAEIADVGPFETYGAAGDEVVDLGNALLTPGLINAHTHLELTCYAGQFPPAPFWRWISELARVRSNRAQLGAERAAVAEGAWQSLRAGVTCVGDISRTNVHWQVLREIPIRKVCFAELLTLADLPPRNPEELRAAVLEIEEDAFLTAAITPHAPYTVPGEQIRAAIVLAEELGRPWCTHWAESREELRFLAGDVSVLPTFLQGLLAQCAVRPPGCGAGAYLARCAAGCRPGLLAHVNYPSEADVAAISAGGHTVVYCPRAHRFFGHEPHPYRRLQEAGIEVALGTDSAASNEDLSILAELNYVYTELADPPSPAMLLRMVTAIAAGALGLGGCVGTLEVGKQADVVAFPLSGGDGDPVAEVIELMPKPRGVWVGGRRVV